MTNLNRRVFLQLAASATGGIMLAGCGGSARTPNGYRFYRLKSDGESVDSYRSGFAIDQFGGSTHISDTGILTFDALDTAKRRGIFQLGLDFGSTTPHITWERTAVMTGDTLNDGCVIGGVRQHDTDHLGNIAAVMEADARHSGEHYGAGLYLEDDQRGFEPLLIAGHKILEGTAIHGGIMGDVSCEEGSIIAHVHHMPSGSYGDRSGSSLVHVPNTSLSSSTAISSTGELLTGTDQMVATFGLIDHNRNGDYTAAVAATHTQLLGAGARPDAQQAHLHIKGHIQAPGDNLLLQPPTLLGAEATEPARDDGGYGSRLCPSGDLYAIMEQNQDMWLLRNNQQILASGEMSEYGTIGAISPGTAGDDGNYYYSVLARSGETAATALYTFDGQRHTPILATGDRMVNDRASVVEILFGTTTRHVDIESRLVCLCSFSDGTTSLVVGVPA